MKIVKIDDSYQSYISMIIEPYKEGEYNDLIRTIKKHHFIYHAWLTPWKSANIELQYNSKNKQLVNIIKSYYEHESNYANLKFNEYYNMIMDG